MGLLGALGELDLELELELAAGMGDGEDDGDADEILLADDILHELLAFAFCIWLANGLLIANLKSNAVKVGENQLWIFF